MIYPDAIITTSADWQQAQQRDLTKLLGELDPEPDPRLHFLLNQFQCAELTALELGCWHGWHTCQLARRFKTVIAVDVRPENLARTLLRLQLLQLTNVTCQLAHADMVDYRCDVLVHLGVLYHLARPIRHLARALCHCKVVCLDTHINHQLPPAMEVFEGQTYRGGRHREHGWRDPVGGVDNYSLWLDHDELDRFLGQQGFQTVHSQRYDVDIGPRVTIVGVRSLLL